MISFLFDQEKLKLVTVLGAGLLCGTALAVIIPEGVHALYEEILEGKVHQRSISPGFLCLIKANMHGLYSHLKVAFYNTETSTSL